MPKFKVASTVEISVDVEAKTAEEAQQIASGWVQWIAPTDEQFSDYTEDHEADGLDGPGTFDVLKAEAEPLKFSAATIADVIAELIEAHMDKCDVGNDDDRISHIVTPEHSANIVEISPTATAASRCLTIKLDDGTAFDITVDEAWRFRN